MTDRQHPSNPGMVDKDSLDWFDPLSDSGLADDVDVVADLDVDPPDLLPVARIGGEVEVVQPPVARVVEMGVEDLAEKRLARLRTWEPPLDAAIGRMRATIGEHDKTAKAWHGYQLARGSGPTNRNPDWVHDPDLEVAGPFAKAELESASHALTAVQAQLSAAIGDAVGSGGLQVGDQIRSPAWEHRLTVSKVFAPSEIALSEVTLTGDGGPATTNWHSPKLDDDGRPVPDESVAVRFERWSQKGLRVGGWIHPVTRGPIQVDS